MPQQDLHARGVRCNSAYLWHALQWLMRGCQWSEIALRTDCSWTPKWLAAAALLWAWSDEGTLGERFVCSRRLVMHLRNEQTELAGSYQAFLKLLRRWTGELVTLLQHALRRQMQQFEQHWKLQGLVVFGVDGSRINLPRTKSHQAAYAPTRTSQRRKKTGRGKQRKPSRQKHAEGPQFWLTTMYHVALHLPWDWRIGPSNSSERADALDMLATIPEKSLLCGDAGFVGYEFVRSVLATNRGLLVRVGSNVKLLKKLGFVRENSQTAYVWPDKVASRNDPPLVFRHIIVQGPRSAIHLVISLPEGQELSDQQVAEIYRARWGVEVFYRQFKQTFQRRKLRSHAAANARVELEWSLVGLWAILLYASHELLRQNIALKRLSAAGSLRAFRQMARDYLHPANPRDTLRIRLRRALVDAYHRSNKASRDYPHKKQTRITGPPKILQATEQQRQRAKTIKQSHQ